MVFFANPVHFSLMQYTTRHWWKFLTMRIIDPALGTVIVLWEQWMLKRAPGLDKCTQQTRFIADIVRSIARTEYYVLFPEFIYNVRDWCRRCGSKKGEERPFCLTSGALTSPDNYCWVTLIIQLPLWWRRGQRLPHLFSSFQPPFLASSPSPKKPRSDHLFSSCWTLYNAHFPI